MIIFKIKLLFETEKSPPAGCFLTCHFHHLYPVCGSALLWSHRVWIKVEFGHVSPCCSSPSPAGPSCAARRWPAWTSGPSGRSAPPLWSGRCRVPRRCHTSCTWQQLSVKTSELPRSRLNPTAQFSLWVTPEKIKVEMREVKHCSSSKTTSPN